MIVLFQPTLRSRLIRDLVERPRAREEIKKLIGMRPPVAQLDRGRCGGPSKQNVGDLSSSRRATFLRVVV